MVRFISVLRTACIIVSIFMVAMWPGSSPANPPQGSNQQFRVGVLPFVDNTGSGGQDMAGALARAVQADMAHSTQLQGRVLQLDNGVNPSSLDATKAVQIGQAQNVDVVMLGTVFEASSQESNKSINGPSIGGFHLGGNARVTNAVVTLQGDLYDVTTGKQIDSIRVTGKASQSNVGGDLSTSLGDISNSGSFDRSPIGKAFHQAASDLARRMANDQSKMSHYAGGGSAGGAVMAGAASGGGAVAAGGQTSAQPAASAATAAPGAAPAAGGAQPELTATNIDFIPGEKTVFYDDFSDMPPGEPPPHWKVRGGAVELRMGGGIRQLTIPNPPGIRLTSSSFAVPKNFTFEVQAVDQCAAEWDFMNKGDSPQLIVATEGSNPLHVVLGPDLGMMDANVDAAKPISLALWAQEGRMRVYVNGQRLIDVNQVKLSSPIDHLMFGWRNWGGCPDKAANGLRSVRLAESAPDPGVLLATTGKYVTHGIYFDTDSDILKPESAPVIKEISTALYKNPDFNLEIDGYTDSTGDAAHNLDLSKRRAAAVQSVLVAQFGIDASRLTSNGFGAGKPIASNSTPNGRAQNRRVEFIKK